MDSTSNASQISEIWLRYLLDCARDAQSCAVPFTDIFGIGAYARCLKTREGTLKDHLKKAGVNPVPVEGVTEVVYHAADVGRVFGN